MTNPSPKQPHAGQTPSTGAVFPDDANALALVALRKFLVLTWLRVETLQIEEADTRFAAAREARKMARQAGKP